MQETDTLESSEEDEIDVDSFVEVDEQVNLENSTGLARLKSCDVVENPPSGLPSDYRDEYSSFSYERYFVFDAEMVGVNDKNINVILPAEEGHSEIEVAYGWTDSNNISDLAGSVVPVEQRTGNSYRIEDFDGFLSGMFSVGTVERLVDRDIFEYSGSSWGVSETIRSSFIICFFAFLAILCGYAAISGLSSLVLGAAAFSFMAFLYLYSSVKKR